MVFLLWAMIGAPYGLRNTFTVVIGFVLEGVLFPISFPVLERIGPAQVFQIILQCSFEATWRFWCIGAMRKLTGRTLVA